MSLEKKSQLEKAKKGTCSNKKKDVPKDLEIVDQMTWYLGN